METLDISDECFVFCLSWKDLWHWIGFFFFIFINLINKMWCKPLLIYYNGNILINRWMKIITINKFKLNLWIFLGRISLFLSCIIDTFIISQTFWYGRTISWKIIRQKIIANDNNWYGMERFRTVFRPFKRSSHLSVTSRAPHTDFDLFSRHQTHVMNMFINNWTHFICFDQKYQHKIVQVI